MSSIAILLVTHNARRLVGETLSSITQQERPPDEVIVVDDESVDDTLEIVSAWAKSQAFDVRIVPNQLPHRGSFTPGPAGSRTTGLMLSQCDLIATLDDDDLMMPWHLRLTEQAMLRHPEMELCFGDATVFSDSGLQSEEPSFFAGKRVEGLRYREDPNGLRILTEPMLTSLVGGSFIPTAANVWRRKTGIHIGGFDRRAGGSDDLLFFSTISRIGEVGYYPFPLARRRVHPCQISNPQNALQHCWDHLNILVMLLERSEMLRLSGDELRTVHGCIVRVESEILYHASRRGLGAYCRQSSENVVFWTSARG